MTVIPCEYTVDVPSLAFGLDELSVEEYVRLSGVTNRTLHERTLVGAYISASENSSLLLIQRYHDTTQSSHATAAILMDSLVLPDVGADARDAVRIYRLGDVVGSLLIDALDDGGGGTRIAWIGIKDACVFLILADARTERIAEYLIEVLSETRIVEDQ